jgi:hypothetical protein
MPTATVTADVIKGYLLNGCGYQQDLVKDDYKFAQGQADIAAFAHYPSDARSACIAAIDCRSDDPQAEVMAHRELGAPLVFACLQNKAQVWKPGRSSAVLWQGNMSASGLRSFFAKHKTELTPHRIYDAKTRGRLPDSESRLPFVDLELLPFAERQTGGRLTSAVVDVVDALEGTFGSVGPNAKQWRWIYKSTFRLLAAKILKDKQVRGFTRLDLHNLEESLGKVQQHYGSAEPVKLGNINRRAALERAVEVFQDLGNLQHLTTETLADVYEEALVTEPMREQHGTHATPPYLVDYILWRLAPWIQEIDPQQLRVFEPACGHAPFLVGMVRLLRTFDLGMTREELSRFCRRRFIGIDRDAFAVEIGRLSLTVADVPYSNGWTGMRAGNMFAKGVLEKAAGEARVFLANPPFERGKPLLLLERTLPHLPSGAVFGIIVPSTLLFTTDKVRPTEFRQWLLDNCQLMEVSLFPDNIFRFSDHECSILLGRKRSGPTGPVTMVRYRRVREEGREAFKEDYRFTTNRTLPQDHLAEQPGCVLWVPELEEELWEWLREFPTLESIATMGQGVRYKNEEGRPEGATTVSSKPFPGAVEGYAFSRGNWFIHEHPPVSFFNLDIQGLFHRQGSGTTTRIPQVIFNYQSVSRGAWRLKPFIDVEGRPVKGNLLTARPRGDATPLEYLWALLCSPLANAYVYTHSLKRHILISDMNRMPVPNPKPWAVRRVVDAARAYLDAARAGLPTLYDPGVSEGELHNLLRRMDAEVLRLYGLPARAERILLDLFRGQQRPGVPGNFARYYPSEFEKPVPLYAYLSASYQRAQNGEPATLAQAQQETYDRLLAKKAAAELGTQEEAELYSLQAEVDGRAYAVQVPDNGWIKAMESKRRKAQQTLGHLAGELASLVQYGDKPNESQTRP